LSFGSSLFIQFYQIKPNVLYFQYHPSVVQTVETDDQPSTPYPQMIGSQLTTQLIYLQVTLL